MKNSTVYLMFVDIKNGTQSNKYYNMIPIDDSTFRVEYGRVDSTKQQATYGMRQWDSIYKSKIKKGYKDISHLKQSKVVIQEDSGNSSFDEFYEVYSKYTGTLVRNTYLSDTCTDQQMKEAQRILNSLSRLKKVESINERLKQLYITIPRRMRDVRSHLVTNPDQVKGIITKEQDALDSMDSSNIIQHSNPFKELGVGFEEEKDHSQMINLLTPTLSRYRSVKIHKVYKIHHKNQQIFDDWVSKQDDKNCQLLFHGTRNPNVFSILRSGLLIRPTNAASFAGSAYGDGIYHSAHTDKSLGYTGSDRDKIFFIQKVHMGNFYTYEGWFKDGKDLSRNDLNYNGLKQRGYDSLYVKPGDGLLNSEYIVYKSEQTVTNFLVWMKV